MSEVSLNLMLPRVPDFADDKHLILLNTLFQSQVTTIDNAAKKCSQSYKAANDLVGIMQEQQIVKEMTGQSRNRIFIFKPYLDIFGD